jgi:hypothetical protein
MWCKIHSEHHHGRLRNMMCMMAIKDGVTGYRAFIEFADKFLADSGRRQDNARKTGTDKP